MTQWKIVATDDPSAAAADQWPGNLLATLAGGGLVATGAYLPWLRTNPGHEPDALGVVPGLMTAGLSLLDFVVLFPVGVVLAALLVRGATRGWALASVVTGLWAVLLSVLLVATQHTAEGLRFVPDIGLALTLLGGLVLALVGGRTLLEDPAGTQRR